MQEKTHHVKRVGKKRQRMDHVAGYHLDKEKDGADHQHRDDPRRLRPRHGDGLTARACGLQLRRCQGRTPPARFSVAMRSLFGSG